jgi:CBS domain-containing protein
MQVKEIMTSEVEFVTTEITLEKTAQKMKDLDVGELPVVLGGEAVGVITDRDIVVRAVAHGLVPQEAKVTDAMTEGVVACSQDDSIEKAAEIMASRKIRRLLVMDAGGKMSGVVSLGDVALNLDKSKVGSVLAQISS